MLSVSGKHCIFATERKTDMTSVAYISSSRKKNARRAAMYEANRQRQLTPKDRLHSVEDFIDKLEQAVLERL